MSDEWARKPTDKERQASLEKLFYEASKEPRFPLPWDCYVQPGMTYADLLEIYGHDAMMTAILHLPQPTSEAAK